MTPTTPCRVRVEAAAAPVQGGALAADRTNGLMDARKLREELRKQGIYVHESDPISKPPQAKRNSARTTATASTTVTDCTSR